MLTTKKEINQSTALTTQSTTKNTLWVKKACYPIFSHNFGKGRVISKILSLLNWNKKFATLLI